MKIKCLIIDDEPLAIQLLEDYISKTYFLESGFSTTNPLQGLEKNQEEDFDLIFLDIQMPELNGIDFLKILNSKTKVILTTAYSDFALESYEFGVVDYLLKPISYERFYKSVLRVKEIMEKKSISESLKSDVEKEYFFFKNNGKQIKINFSELLYIEGLRDYVNIKTNSSELIVLENLKDLEKILPHYFMRIHKSHIINLEKIESIDGKLVYISSKSFQVGETYRENLIKWLKNR